jgi:energy-converting hydrogenase Eha subunit H
MARKPKQYEDDDGRTIVDMNVEGMPWYDARERREKRKQSRAELKEKIARGEALTTRETFRYTFYAVLAGLAAVGVIAGGVCLFIFILWLLWK